MDGDESYYQSCGNDSTHNNLTSSDFPAGVFNPTVCESAYQEESCLSVTGNVTMEVISNY